MLLDFSADQAILDNLEAVTYTSTRRGGDVTASVPDAARNSLSVREAAASGGVYQAGDVVFTVRRSSLATTGYKPADTVTDADANVYTVLGVSDATVGGFVRATCRNLVLAFDLRDSLTLKRPANATDAAGKRVPNLATVAAGVPGRVQKLSGDRGDQFDAPATVTKAVAYVGQQLFPELGDVLEVGSDRYTVVGWKDPDRIDRLMTLDLESRA